MDDNGLTQLVTQPWLPNNTLYLSLCNNPSLFRNVKVLPDLADRDVVLTVWKAIFPQSSSNTHEERSTFWKELTGMALELTWKALIVLMLNRRQWTAKPVCTLSHAGSHLFSYLIRALKNLFHPKLQSKRTTYQELWAKETNTKTWQILQNKKRILQI